MSWRTRALKCTRQTRLTKVYRQTPHWIVRDTVVTPHCPKATFETEELRSAVDTDLVPRTGIEQLIE